LASAGFAAYKRKFLHKTTHICGIQLMSRQWIC